MIDFENFFSGASGALNQAAADPLFNIGLQLMSNPNFGQAIAQGLRSTESIKSNRLDNKIRLAQLEASQNPVAKPTSLEKHMMIASDPNNPLAQMMQRYLFKPTGSRVTVNMPGQVKQGFEKLPNFLGMAKEEGAYYAQNPETGQPELRRIPGTKSTEGERRAAGFASRLAGSSEAVDKLPAPGNSAVDWYSYAVRSLEPGTFTQALAAAPLPEEEKARLAGETSWINANVRDESGAAIQLPEYPRARATYFPMPGDSQEVQDQKRAFRKQTELATQARAGVAPIPEVVEPVPSAPSTGSDFINSYLGSK